MDVCIYKFDRSHRFLSKRGIRIFRYNKIQLLSFQKEIFIYVRYRKSQQFVVGGKGFFSGTFCLCMYAVIFLSKRSVLWIAVNSRLYGVPFFRPSVQGLLHLVSNGSFFSVYSLLSLGFGRSSWNLACSIICLKPSLPCMISSVTPIYLGSS